MALKTFTTADGSANQALVTNGSGVLSFAAVGASAGQVIQVLGATDSTSRTTNSTSFVTASNTLSVTITPSSASNKILILVGGSFYGGGGVNSAMTIFRGATNLGTAAGINTTSDVSLGAQGPLSAAFLDSPSTTSATTYQVYVKTTSPGNAYININSERSSITCLEIKG